MRNENVKQFAKGFCKIAAYGALFMLPRVLHVECTVGYHDSKSAGYYDTVSVIMNTNMFASDKREMISIMKHNAGDEYYKAVIGIINTNMFTSDKIETIKMLH